MSDITQQAIIDACINAVRAKREQAIDKFPMIKEHQQGAFSCWCCRGRGLLKTKQPLDWINVAGEQVMRYHDIKICPACFGDGVAYCNYSEWLATDQGKEWELLRYAQQKTGAGVIDALEGKTE